MPSERFSIFQFLVLIELMGVAHGAVDISGIETQPDEGQQASQGILVLVKGIMGRPE
jgi:hypothetical protein